MITVEFEDLDVEIGTITGYLDVDFNVHNPQPDVGIMKKYIKWWPENEINGTLYNEEGYIVTEFKTSKGQKLFHKIIDLLEDYIYEQCQNNS